MENKVFYFALMVMVSCQPMDTCHVILERVTPVQIKWCSPSHWKRDFVAQRVLYDTETKNWLDTREITCFDNASPNLTYHDTLYQHQLCMSFSRIKDTQKVQGLQKLYTEKFIQDYLAYKPNFRLIKYLKSYKSKGNLIIFEASFDDHAKRLIVLQGFKGHLFYRMVYEYPATENVLLEEQQALKRIDSIEIEIKE